MFDASGAHSGGYLQCVVLLKILVSAICIFATSGAKFVCYLQCFLLLEPMWHAICHVYWVAGANFGLLGCRRPAPDKKISEAHRTKKIAPDKKKSGASELAGGELFFRTPALEKKIALEKKTISRRTGAGPRTGRKTNSRDGHRTGGGDRIH